MRVVLYYLRAFTGDGGMTNAVRELARGMAATGADVSVVFDGGAPEHHERGVLWRPVPHVLGGRWRAPRDPAAVVRGADAVVVHSAWTLANVVVAGEARRRGVHYILAPRGAYDPMIVRRNRLAKAVWWRLAERALVRNANAIHVFFESECAHLAALGYRGPLIVAPNGVEPPRDVRWDGGTGGYVLWMGRFDPEHKGLDLLLHAVALLGPAERPDLRLHGPDWHGKKERIRALVRDLGINGSVRVAEQLSGSGKWEVLARAKGFVYPSRWEGFGNSTAEAASIGVPTLATPYPLARYLADRGGAFVVPPTAADLARGLRSLTSPSAAEVGRTAERIAREELSWAAVSRSWLAQLAMLA